MVELASSNMREKEIPHIYAIFLFLCAQIRCFSTVTHLFFHHKYIQTIFSIQDTPDERSDREKEIDGCKRFSRGRDHSLGKYGAWVVLIAIFLLCLSSLVPAEAHASFFSQLLKVFGGGEETGIAATPATSPLALIALPLLGSQSGPAMPEIGRAHV